jgi:cyclase
LSHGSDKISLNSAACENPDLVDAAAARFGSQCIVVNIDPKKIPAARGWRWEVFTHGGRKPAGKEPVAWAKEVERRGAGEIVVTSMDCDGTKEGYDLELTAAVSDAVRIPVVASGGAGSATHLADAVEFGHADAVLAASIFHYGVCTIRDAKMAIAARGIPVRLG